MGDDGLLVNQGGENEMGKMIDFLSKHRNESFYAYRAGQGFETEALSEASKNSNYIGYVDTFLGVLLLFKEELRPKLFIPLRKNNYLSSDEIIELLKISEAIV